MLNSVALIGRLTRDPELRYTETNSTPVASFTLAVDRDLGDKQTDFIDCKAWRSTAEFVSKYFHKGQLVAVLGRLQIRTWQNRDGENRRAFEVNVDHAYFAEKRDDNVPLRGVDVAPPAFGELGDSDDELPF